MMLYQGPEHPYGATILDFYRLWIDQAHDAGDDAKVRDLVTKYVHLINILVEGSQRKLFPEFDLRRRHSLYGDVS